MNFLINATFEDAGSIGGGVYFTFPFPNAAFIGGRHLKEEILWSASTGEVKILSQRQHSHLTASLGKISNYEIMLQPVHISMQKS